MHPGVLLPLCLYPCHVPLRKAAHSVPARRMSSCWCCTGATSLTPVLVTLPARRPTFTPSVLCWRRSCVPTSLLPWDTSSSNLSLVLPSAWRLSRSSLSESFRLVCTVWVWCGRCKWRGYPCLGRPVWCQIRIAESILSGIWSLRVLHQGPGSASFPMLAHIHFLCLSLNEGRNRPQEVYPFPPAIQEWSQESQQGSLPPETSPIGIGTVMEVARNTTDYSVREEFPEES